MATTANTAEANFPEAVSAIRSDGKEKVTGTGRYTADLTLTGQLYAAFRYTDHPHAKLLKVDVTKAKAVPGVIAIVTNADVPDVKYGAWCKTVTSSPRTRFDSKATSSPGSRRQAKRSLVTRHRSSRWTTTFFRRSPTS